ncbi:hypothetical protein PANT_6c00128 [Moesziomyces antarcticus T-34]|uniref:Uncharacterized protein n=1 Tax=Pseudozyma antarctica (strain T-34) TaxID=1151754 RepID=M9LYL1_PSEA3|nr:hypothetical protein PANT_6c00128 [Moesziomyces antarcticus T-34]
MINPFKKRQQRKAAAAAAASNQGGPTDYGAFPSSSKLPPRPGLFIAAASAAPGSPRSPNSPRQQRGMQVGQLQSPQLAQQPSLDHVLPPTSDFRQSLIMPHLTRRFTLLRAPDGSLVTPDAMRAHLRAQRARARAANLAIGSGMANDIHFLTEDEENAIIEQLKAQARAEGRDFDLEQAVASATVDSWRNGYAAGTDGFGSWGTSLPNTAPQLSSLTESLGDLSNSYDRATTASTSTASPAWSPSRKPGGSSFTGRSSDRDHAHFRNAQRKRSNSKSDGTIASKQAHTPVVAVDEAASQPTTTDASAASASTAGDSPSSTSLLQVPGLASASRSSPTQDSNLLTTLSPEAFKRVSTALDEVFAQIASQNGSSPARTNATLSGHQAQRSSVDSDANSFTSALSNVRAADNRLAPSGAASADAASEDEDAADTSITAPGPTLDAVHIEQGGLAMSSPIRDLTLSSSPVPDTMPGALPGGHADFLPDLPESQTATQLPALVASDSALTVTDAAKGAEPTTQSLAPPNGADAADHLQVSPALTYLSLRNSTATATEVPSQASRIVSSASTIDAHRPGVADPSPDANVSVSTEEPVVRPTSEANRSSLSGQAHPTEGADNTRRSFRTPEMSNANMFAGSPAYSTLSRGDSVVSANSGRSSLAGPPASNYSSSHSRKSSVDKLALARSVAPHPSLREQPSLSSVRRNYRQHVRSATGSSEGSLLGTHASRRSSGAMSPPPMLSRSARSPNYFPPPASSAPMHDYASGFKPPSAVSPAAAAALQAMAGQANHSPQPATNSVTDASNALRSVQSMRNSASTSQSAASPQVPGMGAFGSGSDRAAVPSSPETGSTSFSLHQRNTSLSSSKQNRHTQTSRISSTDEGFAAPRPAPVPGAIASQPTQPSAAQTHFNEQGLMPNPPSEPEQAERWRAMYGIKATDAASLRASSEDVSADPNEEEDLWAKMASGSDPTGADRPVSSLPAGTADERLAGTGITVDQIARFQDHLIQTADETETVPPLPRLQADDNLKERRFAEAKSKGLASPNLVIGTGSEWSNPSSREQRAGNGLAFGPSNGRPTVASPGAPLARQPSSSFSHDPPVSPRAVMYDVTTSHRPTSPPLHSRNGSLNGLPSLLELNGSVGHRNRESFSLSHAVDQASRLHQQSMFTSPSVAEEPAGSDQDSKAVLSSPPVQQHPFNAGYTSPTLPAADSRGVQNFTFPRKTVTEDIGASPRSQAKQFPPEDVWNRYGPQQDSSPDTSFGTDHAMPQLMGSDPTRLLDDVAAQTSAATRALKGTDDGSMPTPPFRTKSISRKKSFKKVSKQISSPQLISTTQKLDHANQIALPPETPAGLSKTSKRSNRSPGWGSLGQGALDGSRGHPKASPSSASQGGSVSKGSSYFHRRRSSSFGHEASPSDSFGIKGGADGAAAEQINGERASVHPNHPYMHGGANGGSLSRLFSKIKSRKNGDQAFGGATIEPFPPQLNAARAAETAPQPPQPPQAPTPVLPPLPLERTTPWTLSSVSSPKSVSSDRGSSLRSPTSPVYTLPIDSTSMPRSKSKKRTPIVLKRESEVVLPGDAAYMPTAIIGRSPEQRARDLAAMPQPAPPISLPMEVGEANAAQTAPQEASPGGQETEAQEAAATNEEHVAAAAEDAPAGLAAEVAEDEMRTPRPPSSWNGEAVEAEDGDTTLPAAAAAASAPTEDGERSVANARKSLRDTIVRRTIIVPAGLELGDYRRSMFGSSRKSRRFAAEDEPLPSAGAGDTSTAADTTAMPAGGVEEAMSTLSSRQTLHPDSGTAEGSKRESRVESSYAGSLYDMYAGDDIEYGSPGSETRELARRSMAPGATRRHIEVTERADGSVVWQVIAGLAERGSVYSDLDPRHSRHNSDASAANLATLDAAADANEWRTPAGLTADDSRSFFTRPQGGHKKSFSFEAMPPLPTSVQQEVFEIANPAPQDAQEEVEKKAEPTTIVYHNDAQLASLLDVLAKGKDSAKFEFHLGPDGPDYPLASSADDQPVIGDVVDADDIELHRNRVEAEIYTLLNQHALRAQPA